MDTSTPWMTTTDWSGPYPVRRRVTKGDIITFLEDALRCGQRVVSLESEVRGSAYNSLEAWRAYCHEFGIEP